MGADAPPNEPELPKSVGRRLKQRVASWGRGPASSRAAVEAPVLGVLFSAPLAFTDGSGKVRRRDRSSCYMAVTWLLHGCYKAVTR